LRRQARYAHVSLDADPASGVSAYDSTRGPALGKGVMPWHTESPTQAGGAARPGPTAP